MSIWSKIFHKKNRDNEIIIAFTIADNLKLFRSVDDAITYLKKKDNKKLIKELTKLKDKISDVKKVKVVQVTEDNEIIEYKNIEEMKKHSGKLHNN